MASVLNCTQPTDMERVERPTRARDGSNQQEALEGVWLVTSVENCTQPTDMERVERPTRARDGSNQQEALEGVWLVTSVEKMLGKIISPEQSKNERQMTSLRDESKPTRNDACVLADDYHGPRGWVD